MHGLLLSWNLTKFIATLEEGIKHLNLMSGAKLLFRSFGSLIARLYSFYGAIPEGSAAFKGVK